MASGAPVKMRRRSLIAVAVILIGGFGALALNLAKIQFVEGETLQRSAINQQMRDTTISPERGSIYDRNGEVLAQSATVWTVSLSPKSLVSAKGEAQTEKNRALVADGLSEILGVDRETLYKKTGQSASYNVTVKKKVETEIKDQVLAFKKENPGVSGAIGLEEDNKRYYPYNDFAATVLGFTGTDNQGLAGVEAYYDKYLTGVPGRVMTVKNAVGTEMPFEYEQRVDAQDGNDLILTLDKTLQGILEKHIDRAVADNKVTQRAVGIIIDVNTFEVLAMTTRPSFNCNEPLVVADEAERAAIEALPAEEQAAARGLAQSQQWRNKAISDTYEPGSVFKCVTASAALDEGVVNLTSTFTCNGVITIGGRLYQCNNRVAHGVQNIQEALMHSCNPSFIQIGQKLGIHAFCQYYSAFGLTERTGIDLPGEVTPEAGVHYHAEESMGIVELASSSFGQSRKVSPLQMVSAMAAAVNGGKMGTPHVVKQIVDGDGNIVKTADAGIKRQVVSETTSQIMRESLQRVVEEGGGKNAGIKGYKIGGKTGTSNKLDTGDKTARVASFCGFAPADDPQIACIIVIDEPRANSMYGSVVAAPVFKAVMEEALPYLGVEKTYAAGEEPEESEVSAPKVVGDSVADAKAKISEQGLNARVLGSGETVLAQIPNPGTTLSKNATVVLYTDDDSRNNLAVVPNLMNMTPSQVNAAAAKAGVNVRFTGQPTAANTVSVKQDVEEGSKVSPGTVITVDFAVTNLIE